MPAPDSIINEAAEQMRAAGAFCHLDRLTDSHGGNLSTRLSADQMLITRTGHMLPRLAPTSFLEISTTTEGDTDEQASFDLPVHRAIYRHPEAAAVVHAHPAYTIALSLSVDEITPRNFEAIKLLGPTRVLDVAWEDSPAPIHEALAESPIVTVRGHGTYARGETIWEALHVTSMLELASKVVLLTGG